MSSSTLPFYMIAEVLFSTLWKLRLLIEDVLDNNSVVLMDV